MDRPQPDQERILKILAEARLGQISINALCKKHHISRTTFTRWKAKYEAPPSLAEEPLPITPTVVAQVEEIQPVTPSIVEPAEESITATLIADAAAAPEPAPEPEPAYVPTYPPQIKDTLYAVSPTGPHWLDMRRLLAIVVLLILVITMSFGRCALINRLISYFGPVNAFFIMAGILFPCATFIISQLYWDSFRKNVQRIREGNLLLASLYWIVLVIAVIIIMIIPNILCFIINATRTLLNR